MYNPSSFAETRIDVLHSFIHGHPLATIVTCGPEGPEATHAPVVLHGEEGSKGVLRCHFARANRHWLAFQSSPAVLAILQGPEHYVTPSWYPAKQEHGKVVPTWNYAVVHVRGRAKLFEQTEELMRHLRSLTDRSEATFEAPWSIDDAPKEYLEGLSRAIIGIEIAIDSIEGKWKVSQNRSEADRKGVVAGLDEIGLPRSVEMARLVEERIRK